MNYYRRIQKPIDELKYKMQIGALLLNIKSLDNKINTIEKDMSSLIKKNTIINETHVIKNFKKSRNYYEIFKLILNNNFSNGGIFKINANYHYINNNNFSHIYKFYNGIHNFKELILDHKNNIINDKFEISSIKTSEIKILIYLVNNDGDNSTIELYDYNTINVIYKDNINTIYIDNNKKDIKSNLRKIETNEKDIANNLKEIETNETDITSNLEKIEKIETDTNYNTKIIEKMRYTILDETYTISKKSGDKIFEMNFNNKFTNKGILKIKANFDHNFSRIYTFRNNDDTFKSIPQVDTNFDEFEIDAVDSSNIKISISLADNTFELYQGTLNIKYEDNNDMTKIEKNTLEIKNLKKNKSYLKNLYNEIFYQVNKLKINFNSTFYEKVFNDSYTINDFIEISFKINFECDSLSLLNYIKFIYEIFDENNNSLFIKTARLNEYKHFQKYVFID